MLTAKTVRPTQRECRFPDPRGTGDHDDQRPVIAYLEDSGQVGEFRLPIDKPPVKARDLSRNHPERRPSTVELVVRPVRFTRT
ncbi:hypothetical protein GCM10027436_30100 [Actinophytocola sediminis]